MKTTISRKLLLEALTIVGLCVPRKSTLPVLEAVHIKAAGGLLSFHTTNLDQTILVELEAEANGEVVTPWRKLKEFVARSEEESVSLVVEATVQKLRVTSGSAVLVADIFKADDFPPGPSMQNAGQFAFPSQLLAAGIRLTGYAQSIDDSRYILNGILFEHLTAKPAYSQRLNEKERSLDPKIKTRKIPARPESTALVATDGRRLAYHRLKLERPPDKDISIIIPTEAIDIFKKVHKRFQNDLEMDVAESYLQVKGVGVTITTKLIDGNFPNFRQVIPYQDRLHDFSFDREKLIASIKKTIVKPTKPGDTHSGMTFTFHEHILEMTHQDKQAASVLTNRINYYGASNRRLRVGFNPVFIVEALQSLTCPRVILSFVDELTPMTLLSSTDGDHRIVIMPMRVS